MKIIVLNGSPKGEASITLQYVAYIRNIFLNTISKSSMFPSASKRSRES